MIKLIKPYIDYNEVEEDLKQVFATKQFTKGPFVNQFSNALAEYTKVKYVHLTTSATTALSTCLALINVKKGDEVIISDFSFPATANVVENTGAKPVFVDVDLATYNMEAANLESAITPKTKAIIFVDALGNPSNLLDIKAICQKHHIVLIEDAACSIGSSINNTKVGTIADLTCFSFHPRKLLTTGEGGAILTNNSEWNEQLKILLNHGATITNNQPLFISSGYNYRLPDISCVIGIHQLKKLDSIIEKRQKMKDEYVKALAPLGYQIQKVNNDTKHNLQSIVFTTPKYVDRDRLIQYLFAKKIETTIGTYSLSQTPYYLEKYQSPQSNSKHLQNITITLPCHDDVPIDYITEIIKKY
ncbi:DegT/DnrJ/EryC1/StrS family aminotransferase [Alkalihalobacillus sp. 1P02AB]|uniref:DegT/DnrJ/EryC1/StrS family aminotransferase n=1 Tax=Alkalihalobacillus sp. 1P02AB TaxID=3132260 RepID=UPI0039A68B4F